MAASTELPDMDAVKEMLLQHTPASSLDKPLTEIVIFKLLPAHTPPSAATLARVEKDFAVHSAGGVGVRRVAWGMSLTDPATVALMLDWRRIQDHWDFWATKAFVPVIKAIQELFEPGRPLVRHFDYGGQGMLRARWQRLDVWQAAETKVEPPKDGKWKSQRRGPAADLGETDWYNICLGYASESELRDDDRQHAKNGEIHLMDFRFIEGADESS